jgi:ribosomal protein S18 acetylase RimI-like enzyme
VIVEPVTRVNAELVEAFRRLMPQLNPGHPLPDARFLERMLAQECLSLIAARDPSQDAQGAQGGRIIGLITLVAFTTVSGAYSWIEDLVVDEPARHQGVGEALTLAAIQRAREHGAQTVDLTSRPSRQAANRLYLRLGFEQRNTNLYRLKLD